MQWKKGQNNAFWIILAYKAIFYDQQSTVQMWNSIIKSFRFWNFPWSSCFFVCLVLVEKTFHWQEFQYPGLFCVKPTLKGQHNFGLHSISWIFEESWGLERFEWFVDIAKIGEDYGREITLILITYLVAERSRAPGYSPREDGWYGFEP